MKKPKKIKVKIAREQLYDFKPTCGVRMCAEIGCLPEILEVEILQDTPPLKAKE